MEPQTESLNDEEIMRIAEEIFEKQQRKMNLLTASLNHPEIKSKLITHKLLKQDDYFGYGIAFHTENIQPTLPTHKLVYPLIEIEERSPAENVGLKHGQRVVAINDQFINQDLMTLEDVVQSIEDSYYNRTYTDITVLNSSFWEEIMNDSFQFDKLQVKSTKQSIVKETKESRLCTLKRKNKKEKYGFEIKNLSEKFYVKNIVNNSLAAKSGLKEGDLILEVNNLPVDGLKQKDVIDKVAQNPLQIDLLVVSELSNEQNDSDDDDIANYTVARASNQEEKGVRVCNLIQQTNYKGFGFTLHGNENGPHSVSVIEKNSPAMIGGLKINDLLLKISGVDVSTETYEKTVELIIKESEKGFLKLEVIDPNSYNKIPPKKETKTLESSVIQNKNSISETKLNCREVQNDLDEEQEALEERLKKYSSDNLNGARICFLRRGENDKGLGFTLRGNPTGPHSVSSVDANSPASIAGLKSNDLVLKVNNINTVGEVYGKMVGLIKMESEKGQLELEVIEKDLCPKEVLNTIKA